MFGRSQSTVLKNPHTEKDRKVGRRTSTRLKGLSGREVGHEHEQLKETPLVNRFLGSFTHGTNDGDERPTPQLCTLY